jgi:hypothetical protein
MVLTDAHLERPEFLQSEDPIIKEFAERIVGRLLPRQVFGFVTNNRSKAKAKLQVFAAMLADPELGGIDRRQETINVFESALCEEMDRQLPELKGQDTLLRAGVWLDVPKPPSFEKTESLLVGEESPVQLKVIFPIKPWVDGYAANRYYIRIFAFSEYMSQAKSAIKYALSKIVRLTEEELTATEEFFSK